MFLRSREIQVAERHYLLLKWNLSYVEVTLLQGEAEVWGEDLPLLYARRYPGPAAITIYAQQPTRILVLADDLAQVSEIQKPDQDYPMANLLNVHKLLHAKRLEAAGQNVCGPVAIVLSQSRLGKTALSKFFVNQSCKHGQRPMFVDLDPHNLVGVKGSLGAAYCQRGFPQDFFEVKEKLIYYTGSQLMPQFYKSQTANFVALIQAKLQREASANSAGAVVALPAFLLQPRWRQFTAKLIADLGSEILIIVDSIESQTYWRSTRALPHVFALRQPVSFQTGQLAVSRAQTYFRGTGDSVKSVKLIYRFNQVRIYRLHETDGKTYAKELAIREHNIVKAVIAIVKCSPKNDGALPERLAASPLLCLAQVSSINDKDERIEFIVAGEGLERTLKTCTWVYGDLTFS